jgi:putative (di)nucleoside polyphosphate hydrolase
MAESDVFRANAAAVIINSRGQVLALERDDIPGAWQFPQGGVDKGENPLDTIKREIYEEVGIKVDKELILLAEYPVWLAYEYPPHIYKKYGKRGQAQKWFLFQVKNDEIKLNLSEVETVEFVAWRWADIEEVVEQMVDFKRPVYEIIALWVKTLLG